MNTKQRGIYRFVAYRVGDHYVGVCLDLNIIEKDGDLVSLKRNLEEKASDYIDHVRVENLPDSYLNKKAPNKYFKILKRIENMANLDKAVLDTPVKGPVFDSASLSYRQYNFA